ncbi:hypothetical protein PSOL_06380 [Candidatus Phytoplasma solani]
MFCYNLIRLDKAIKQFHDKFIGIIIENNKKQSKIIFKNIILFL